MNKMLKAIVGLLVLTACVIIVFLVIWSKKGNNDEKKKDYVLLENNHIKYKYIKTYDEYLDLMDDEEISKSDDYKSYSKEDFKNNNYLFIIMPYDSCSESISNDNLVKDGNTYKLYLDVSYKCGVCPLAKKVFAYKVNKTGLKVNIYTKTIKREECDPNVSYKPMIYIYPEKDMDLNVTLGNPNNLLYTYPKYNNSWNVHVTSDGNIYDYDTKRNYYGLYWEGKDDYKLDMTKGFVVKGSETVKFLEDKLTILGLNDYEINEFIVYWIDKLEANNYNFISFRSIEDIEKSMPLYLSEKPDTIIRVMMDYKPLDSYINVEEQQLTKVERNGFTVVEWGGTGH